MSLTTAPDAPIRISKAEQRFRDAFGRLKSGTTALLCKGSKVSRNNVAREAGCDPSALKRSRFPALCDDIQRWVEAHGGSEEPKSLRQQKLAVRARSKGLRDRLAESARQRDLLATQVILLEERVIELFIENERLKACAPANNVKPFSSTATRPVGYKSTVARAKPRA
jgi:hypothetical protein